MTVTQSGNDSVQPYNICTNILSKFTELLLQKPDDSTGQVFAGRPGQKALHYSHAEYLQNEDISYIFPDIQDPKHPYIVKSPEPIAVTPVISALSFIGLD